jgi:glucosamine-phosphate N-acetyltransferase
MLAPEIRDLTHADIYNKGFIDSLAQLSPINPDSRLLERVYYDRQHTGIRTFVAVADDEIIGTASLYIEAKFTHNGGKVAHIEDVGVLPDYQGLGVGAMLINHILEIAGLCDCYKVILQCNDKVAPFYKKLGFNKVGNEMRRG